MSILESIQIAIFLMAVVFAVLVVLCVLIKLFSVIITKFETRIANRFGHHKS